MLKLKRVIDSFLITTDFVFFTLRLPRNEAKKRIWLEAIGNENLINHTKEIFICSLHFEDNSFNRTLGVVRLRDDAVPSLYKQVTLISYGSVPNSYIIQYRHEFIPSCATII